MESVSEEPTIGFMNSVAPLSEDPISIEDVKPLLACRGCLAASLPLRILECALAALYEELVGTKVREADIFPKFVCSYCHALLVKFKAFRDKCRSNQDTFRNLYSAGIPVTLDLLKSGVTGVPYSNLVTTIIQLISLGGNVPNVREEPKNVPSDIKETVNVELDHSVNLTNNERAESIHLRKQMEESSLAINTEIKNKDNDSNIDTGIPDCLAGLNNDIYRKDADEAIKEYSEKIKTVIKSKGLITADAKKIIKVVNMLPYNSTDKSSVGTSKSAQKTKPKKVYILKLVDNKNKANENDKSKVRTEKRASDDDETVVKAKKKKNDDVDSDDSHETVLNTKKTTDHDKKEVKTKKKKKKTPPDSDKSLNGIMKWIETLRAKKTREKETRKSMISSRDIKKLTKIYTKKNYKPVVLSKEDQILKIRARKNAPNYEEANYKCEMCYRTFNHSQTYNNHMARHELSQGDCICEICSLRYDLKRKLKRHIVSSHTFEYICNECGKVCKSCAEADKHYKWHKGVKFDCKICGKSYRLQTSLMGHIHLTHGGSVQCSICSEKFIGKKGLRSHMLMSHKEAVAAVCNDCGVQFHSVNALERHLAAGDHSHRPCAVCGDSFPNDELLQEHQQEKHERFYECEICHRQFKKLSQYRKHHHTLNKSIGKKPPIEDGVYICDVCGITKTNRKYFKNHLDLHSRPFKCDICDKGFAQKASLRVHLSRRHIQGQPRKLGRPKSGISPPPPAPCQYCGKQFSCKGNRIKHENLVHRKVRDWGCETCGATYQEKSALHMHINTKHLGLPWPKRDRSKRRQSSATQDHAEDYLDKDIEELQ